jgi:hypothetical protein
MGKARSFPPPTPTLSSRVRVYKEERNYILGLVNVLLIQKSILRDATTDLSLHYLAKVRGTE